MVEGQGTCSCMRRVGKGVRIFKNECQVKNRNCYLPIVKKTDPVENWKNLLVFQVSPRIKTNRIERQEAKDEWCFAKISDVDPNTLNWDPDPEF